MDDGAGNLKRAASAGEPNLRDNVVERAPDVYITFVSIIIGIILADLLQEARARMDLWPLDMRAIRDWGQVFGIAASALGSWGVYSYLGIAQRQVPTFRESVAAFAGPVSLLITNSLAGQPNAAGWFFGASLFLGISLIAALSTILGAAATPDGRSFRRVARPAGALAVLYVGVPVYVLAGIGSLMGWLPLWAQAVAAWSSVPAAAMLGVVFFSDWRRALKEAPRARRVPAVPAPKGQSVLEQFVREKAGDVFITLISIIIGMALQDLVDQARERIHLWPLDPQALAAWGQIGGVVSSGICAWIVISHLAISRRGVPGYAEMMSGAVAPFFIIVANGLIGIPQSWLWFYAAGIYLAVCVLTIRMQIRFADNDTERSLYKALEAPLGYVSICYLGAPGYIAFGLAMQWGLAPDWLVLAVTTTSGPAAMLCAWLFFRDWRRAILEQAPLA